MKFKIPEVHDPMRFPKAARRALAQRQEAIWKAHAEHIERLHPLLPPALQQLNSFSLDDGILHSVRVDPEKKALELCLGVGDIQRSYFTMVLNYKEISLTSEQIALLGLLADKARRKTNNIDINWGELEIVETPSGEIRYIHRILWHDLSAGHYSENSDSSAPLEPEIELRFGDLELKMIPAEGLKGPKDDPPLVIVWDRDEAEAKMIAELLEERAAGS